MNVGIKAKHNYAYLLIDLFLSHVYLRAEVIYFFHARRRQYVFIKIKNLIKKCINKKYKSTRSDVFIYIYIIHRYIMVKSYIQI